MSDAAKTTTTTTTNTTEKKSNRLTHLLNKQQRFFLLNIIKQIQQCIKNNNALYVLVGFILGSSGDSAVKNPLANARDTGWIPGSGRSPGEENGNSLQYPCLGNPMDTGV